MVEECHVTSVDAAINVNDKAKELNRRGWGERWPQGGICQASMQVNNFSSKARSMNFPACLYGTGVPNNGSERWRACFLRRRWTTKH